MHTGVSRRVGQVVSPIGDLRRQWYRHRRTRVDTDLDIGKPHVERGQVSVASTEGGNEKDESARRLQRFSKSLALLVYETGPRSTEDLP